MIVAQENVLDTRDQVALHGRNERWRRRRERYRAVAGVEQRLRCIVPYAYQHDLAGGRICCGQDRRAVDDIARNTAARKAVPENNSVAVRREHGGAGYTHLAVDTTDS